MRILDVILLQKASFFAVIYTKSRGRRKTSKIPIWLELDGKTPAIWMARSQVDLLTYCQSHILIDQPAQGAFKRKRCQFNTASDRAISGQHVSH
jgi:hypothetical protein